MSDQTTKRSYRQHKTSVFRVSLADGQSILVRAHSQRHLARFFGIPHSTMVTRSKRTIIEKDPFDADPEIDIRHASSQVLEILMSRFHTSSTDGGT